MSNVRIIKKEVTHQDIGGKEFIIEKYGKSGDRQYTIR